MQPEIYFHFEEVIFLNENIFIYLCKNKIRLILKIFGAREVIHFLYFVSFGANLKHLKIMGS